MKYINKFRKAFRLATVLMTLATLEALIYQLPVLSGAEYPIRSNADNPFCYMQTEGGLILNLESICEVKRLRPREPLSSKDRQFIEDYRKLLMGYPKAQTALSSVVEKNPLMIIRKATEVCNQLKTGKFSASGIAQPDADADILNSLAPEYYCREFDD